MLRVLVTGAGGRIGTAFRLHARDRYTVRLGMHPDDAPADTSEQEVMRFDVADLENCRAACRDMDVVLHLAADPSPDAEFYDSLLDNNIKGTYNMFLAAADAGCARMVYASSMQTIEALPHDVQASEDAPIHPGNMYGVSKCFGEATAHYFAHARGLSTICVRIGAYDSVHPGGRFSPRDLSAYVSPRDLHQLFRACIETPDVQFAIVYGLSNNRFSQGDLTLTRRLLGYAPEDDAFTMHSTHLPNLFRRD